MIALSSLLTFFLACILGLSFLMVSRMRLSSFVYSFGWQSFFLALYVGTLGLIEGEPTLFVAAGLILALKALILPQLLLFVAKKSGASGRLSASLRGASLSFIAALLVAFSFVVVETLPFSVVEHTFLTPISLSLLLIGFFLLVSRGDLFGESIGFLVMENGIFLFGLALTGGMPLLIDLGILFDVMIGFILMTALAYRVQKTHASVDVVRLRELTD